MQIGGSKPLTYAEPGALVHFLIVNGINESPVYASQTNFGRDIRGVNNGVVEMIRLDCT